jgi:hypothetical protein
MTQTGSVGVISAASSRHPKPYSRLMMVILPAMHKGGRAGVRDIFNGAEAIEIGSKARKEHH